MNEPDFYKEPYLSYCNECGKYVISLFGHCYYNDKHLTGILSEKEKKSLPAIKGERSTYQPSRYKEYKISSYYKSETYE